jgi:hypothetical protein
LNVFGSNGIPPPGAGCVGTSSIGPETKRPSESS